HIPRGVSTDQDGDRIVRFTSEGAFVGSWGRQGANPGEFMGPHALAFDSQGRLFLADRSNNRVQIFDRNMKFVDEWRHFGRPSGVAILKDDAMFVSDSESSYPGFHAVELGPTAPGAPMPRNPGWQSGIR